MPKAAKARRRRQRGHGSIVWRGSVPYAVYRVNGRQKWERFDTEIDAEQRLLKVRQERAETGTPTVPSQLTFAAFARSWLSDREGVIAGSTFAGYKAIIENHFIPAFGADRLPKLTTDVIERYRAAKLTGKNRQGNYAPLPVGGSAKPVLSPQSVKNQLNLLHQVLEAARIQGKLIGGNPVSLIDRPKVVRDQVIPLTADELARLLEATPPEHRMLMTMLGHQGLRLNEALSLRVGDYNPKERRLSVQRGVKRDPNGHLVAGPLKTPNARRPLRVSERFHELLMAHLKQLPRRKRDALMFPNSVGNLMSGDNFRNRVFRPAAERANLDPSVTIHRLRHTYASLAIARGVNPKLLSKRMGHASVAFTLETYGHLYEEHLAEASDGLDDQ